MLQVWPGTSVVPAPQHRCTYAPSPTSMPLIVIDAVPLFLSWIDCCDRARRHLAEVEHRRDRAQQPALLPGGGP
jgi:hypothetical protein